jgi:hypothetical protein
MKCSLPIPYRIHSMLPQPGNRNLSGSFSAHPAPAGAEAPEPPPACAVGEEEAGNPAGSNRQAPFETATAVVRTPIDNAPPLAERAGQLLLRQWPRSTRPLQAVELEVSGFEPPVQLSFAEIDRIGESGGLRGMDGGRVRALMRQEEILAARYGDPTFRHVTHVDPSSILTERRFRWNVGLLRDRSLRRGPIHRAASPPRRSREEKTLQRKP